MASSEFNESDVTLIKSKVTVTQETQVSVPEGELSAVAKEEIAEISKDITKLSRGALKTLSGFRSFILRGNVVDLAIGIVIGAAFTAVVNALVSDIITPLIPVSKTGSLATWTVQFYYVQLHIGAFINAVISFLIVAAVLYFFVVQPVNALVKLYQPKQMETKETRDCPYCFQAVHVKASRCPFCTSHLLEETKHDEKDPVLMLPDSLEKLSDKLAESIAKKASVKLEKIADTSGEADPAAAKE
jgi:large conductance mechanosensitive channel